MKWIALPALTLGLVAALSAPVAAQSTWLDREHRPSVLVEALFPNFEGGTDFPTWTWFAATRLPLGPTKMFVGELPYSHGQVDNGGSTGGQGSIGNPYLGIEYAPKPSGLLVELGTRIPLVSDDKPLPVIVGYYTDVERQEAFVPDQLTLRLGLHYHRAANAASPVAYDVRVTPSAWIRTSEGSLGDPEMFVGYGAWLRYEGRTARVGGGLTGRWNATNDGADFSDASEHQLDLAADFLEGSVRPGVMLKLPLDDNLSDTLNSVYGVTMTILPGL